MYTQIQSTQMSCSELLTMNLRSVATTEVNLVTMIQDFAYSRTVEEIRRDVLVMIASLDPKVHGIHPEGFRMLLNLALRQGIDAAKNMFIRKHYDTLEWERLGQVLQNLPF